jgi:hypothetical protein
LILLSCAAALTFACRGDPDPPAKPTTGPDAAVTPAFQPTAAPTAVLSPVPRQTREPTEPRDDGLTFHFGPGVSDFDRSLISRAVVVTRELLADESGLLPPAAVFADTSAFALAEAFADDALEQRWRAAGMTDRLNRTIAEASYRGIVINTGVAAWQAMDPTERLRAVAHEFVHVIQLEHMGLRVASETFAGPNTEAPVAGPFWLLEGSAEVVSWLVLQELALGSYADALVDYAEIAGTDAELVEMESYFGFAEAGRPGLGLSVLATDYLLRSRSLGGLFELWTAIGNGSDWRNAFQRHFGLPTAFFYPEFARFYETTWAALAD